MDPKTPYAYGLCLILSSHRFPWRHTFHMLGIPSRKSVAFQHSLIFTNSSWVVYTSIILQTFLPDWPFKTTHETWPGIHGFLFVFKFRGRRVPGITLLENDPALQLHVTLTEPQKNMKHKSVLGCFWDQVVWGLCWDGFSASQDPLLRLISKLPDGATEHKLHGSKCMRAFGCISKGQRILFTSISFAQKKLKLKRTIVTIICNILQIIAISQVSVSIVCKTTRMILNALTALRILAYFATCFFATATASCKQLLVSFASPTIW